MVMMENNFTLTAEKKGKPERTHSKITTTLFTSGIAKVLIGRGANMLFGRTEKRALQGIYQWMRWNQIYVLT